MDDCPNEILDLIFASACSDDGHTGRSLSLVSKHIRDTSCRYAFQSIALYGPYQLYSFAYILDKDGPKDRTIRHLYLVDRSRYWVEGFPNQDKERGSEQWHRDLEHYAASLNVSDIASPLEYASSPVLRILEVVSPTLETLILLLFDQYDEQPLSDAISFPMLRELTLHGSSLTHFVWRGANRVCTPSPLPQCLSLRRLHVIFALGRPWTEVVPHLAPHLTHLRMSGLPSSPLPLIDIVRGLERLSSESQGNNTSESAGLVGFPPTLERILIQLLQFRFPGAMRPENNQSAQSLLVTPMGSYLKNVAMQDAQRRIVLLKPAWMSGHIPELLTGESADVAFYTGLKTAWQRRVDGLESAVWDVEQESVLASYGYWAGDRE